MAGSLEWLLLAYRMPREPSTPRIAVWRKLTSLGVAKLGDGLVGLPADARSQERLGGVADEVGEGGGEAAVGRGGGGCEAAGRGERVGGGGTGLSHRQGDCSFETALRVFGLDDPVLWDIARIVHEADLDDERFDAPAAPGLDVLCRGLSMILDDPGMLAATGALFDGLYEYRRRALLLGREPS